MSKRVAFFSSKQEVEKRFSLPTSRENLYEPNYNITSGQYIPAIYQKDDIRVIERVRWGDEASGSEFTDIESAKSELENSSIVRCVVPVSGFFVWKDDKEEGSPFFVRMLNDPLMTLAGTLKIENHNPHHFKLIEGKSNVLVQPMTETMPVLLDDEFVNKWLSEEGAALSLLEMAEKRFLLTDFSVMRVSKKVNNPENNSAKMIQPIPK